MRKRGRETCERYIDRLPLTRPTTGDLACALTGNRSQAGTESTEPHQPRLFSSLNTSLNFSDKLILQCFT